MANEVLLDFIAKWVDYIPNSQCEEFGFDVGMLATDLKKKAEKPCFCQYELTPAMCPTHGVI